MVLKHQLLLKIVAFSMVSLFAFIGASPSHADTAQLSDANLIAIYNQVNAFDIETGTLGALKGKSEGVKALGEMVKRDHTAVLSKLQAIAHQRNIAPELPLSRTEAYRDHIETINRLTKLTGEAFDKAYLLHEVKFHTEAINAVKNFILPQLQDSEVKQFMTEVLPGFEMHLNSTKQEAKRLGYL